MAIIHTILLRQSSRLWAVPSDRRSALNRGAKARFLPRALYKRKILQNYDPLTEK
jgi:hypothetical protein